MRYKYTKCAHRKRKKISASDGNVPTLRFLFALAKRASGDASARVAATHSTLTPLWTSISLFSPLSTTSSDLWLFYSALVFCAAAKEKEDSNVCIQKFDNRVKLWWYICFLEWGFSDFFVLAKRWGLEVKTETSVGRDVTKPICVSMLIHCWCLGQIWRNKTEPPLLNHAPTRKCKKARNDDNNAILILPWDLCSTCVCSAKSLTVLKFFRLSSALTYFCTG